MRPQKVSEFARQLAVPAFAAGAALVLWTAVAAHENHAPLPSQGVTIAGDTIMLSEKARAAIGLTTEKVELRDLQRAVTVNSRAELPWHAQAMITSLVSGRIERVLVRPGDTVTAGEELARVASEELEGLQASLLQTKAEADLAQKLVEQRVALDQRGAIAGKALLESQSGLAGKSAALGVARQKLAALGLDEETIRNVERTGRPLPHVSITSPIGGVITHADVRVGQVVRPDEHLYHVVDPAVLWIIGEVLESEVRFLAKGQPVVGEFAALPGVMFHGRIDHLRLKMHPHRRTLGVVAAIENPGGRLRAGMSGRARISVEVVKDAVVCPADAVIRSRSGNYLLVERMPGKYENRRVELGLADRGRVEVLDGAFPGDRVVVVGNSLLAALLGNEHKARVDDEAPGWNEARPNAAVATAHGAVELPLDRQALAAPPVEGRVRRILVQPSQQVAAGAILAEIDSLVLRSVQLELFQTVTQERLLADSLQRLEGLGDGAGISQRQLWELRGELASLRLRVESQKRQLTFFGLATEDIERLSEVDLTRSDWAGELTETLPVRAPAAGRLVGFQVVPGQTVQPDVPLFEIHDLSKIWVKGYIHEREASAVEVGQIAHVRFAAYPGLEAVGAVVRISPAMEEKMRVLPVWIEVDNPDHLLMDGMLARITVLPERAGEGRAGRVGSLAPIDPVRK